jgi:hypothetical protein
MPLEYPATLERELAAAKECHAALLEALSPFVMLAGLYSTLPDDYIVFSLAAGDELFSLGDLRRLAKVAALKKPATPG